MKWIKRLKRSVAPGLRALAGGRRPRPDAGARRELARARTTRREVISLSWPIAAAMLGDTAMGLVDTKLVSGLGPAALGGVGIGTTLMWLGYSMVFGLMRGVKVRTAHAVGESRAHDAVRFAQAGVLVAVVLGTMVWALTRDVTGVLHALGVNAETIPYARDFLAARTFGAPGVCVLSAMVQYRQGLGDSRTPMLAGLGGNVFNAVVAYGLIYGRFGMPALGVRGAGFGTALAESGEAVALLTLLVSDARRARPAITLRAAAREVAELGVPTGLHFGLETLAFTTFTAILGAMGAREIAAHQIAMAVIRTSFLPGVAVAEAASVLVGRALGRRRLDEADRVARIAVMLAVTFMALCGAVFAVGGSTIARGFTHDAGVAFVVRRLLLVAAVFQICDGVTIVLRGALRGAKDVRMVALIGTSIAWCCIPGVAFLLGRVAGWGALGGWCGFIAETTLSAVLFTWRWQRGAWRARFAPVERVAPAPVAMIQTSPA